MCINICRIFTLFHDRYITDGYKNFTNTHHFVNIGYYDWLDTKRYVFENVHKLENLYNYNLELNMNTTKFQSYQNMYGFYTTDNEDKDLIFWEERKLPLLFLTAIQFEDYSDKVYEDIQKTISYCNRSNNFSCIAYKTLDNYDLIICSKSNSYLKLIEFINTLYLSTQYKISYMYTNFSIDSKLLNSDEFENIVANEKIDSICIKAVFSCEINLIHKGGLIGKLDYINDILSKELYDVNDINKDSACYEILGDTDCRFIAREIRLFRVLKLFSEKGVLYRSKENFSKMFLSTMTSLNIKLGLKSDNQDDSIKKYEISLAERLEANEKDSEEFNKLLNLLDRILNVSNNISIKNMCYQIDRIINFLSYINNQSTQKYQLLLIQPINTIIKILENKVESNSLYVSELYDYINYIYSHIMEIARTNIRNFQVSDYSITSYYSPAKLLVFYLLMINKISDFYRSFSEEDGLLRYDFVIIPTNKTFTFVTQAFKDEFNVDKLMVAHITEKDFYNVKDLLLQEAHEAAHFVGNESIRKRKIRFNLIKEYWIRNIYEYIKGIISENISDNFSKSQVLTFNELLVLVESKIDNEINWLIDKLIEDRVINVKDDFYYSKNIKYIYQIFADDMIMNISDIFFSEIEYKLKRLDENSSLYSVETILSTIELYQNMQKKVNDRVHFFVEKSRSKKEFNEPLRILMSESYSDLSAIITFNLSAEDLFESIFLHMDDDSVLQNNSLFVRSCIVLLALSDSYSEYSDCYSNTFYNLLNNNDYRSNINNSRINLIRKTCGEIKLDKGNIAHYSYRYILECIKSYSTRLVTNSSLKEQRNKLAEIYQNVCNTNFNELIDMVNNLINEIK